MTPRERVILGAILLTILLATLGYCRAFADSPAWLIQQVGFEVGEPVVQHCDLYVLTPDERRACVNVIGPRTLAIHGDVTADELVILLLDEAKQEREWQDAIRREAKKQLREMKDAERHHAAP